jgi:hypothetical protein
MGSCVAAKDNIWALKTKMENEEEKAGNRRAQFSRQYAPLSTPAKVTHAK